MNSKAKNKILKQLKTIMIDLYHIDTGKYDLDYFVESDPFLQVDFRSKESGAVVQFYRIVLNKNNSIIAYNISVE